MITDGDDEILVCRVSRVAHPGTPKDPFLFYKGKYCPLKPENTVAEFPGAAAWAHG
jgi:hypothetical protein